MNKKDITVNKLKSLGETILEDVGKNKVPTIKVPSR
jgi:DNA topoisomerase-6 subunit A